MGERGGEYEGTGVGGGRGDGEVNDFFPFLFFFISPVLFSISTCEILQKGKQK